MIYLDHNATTPCLPAAADAVRDVLLAIGANAGSQHSAGRDARRVLGDTRDRVATLLGADPARDRLVLTSGGTESNNLALRSAMAGGGHLIVSSIEHPSIDATARRLEAEGVAVDWAPVDSDGVVVVEKLSTLLRPETRLVSVMLANNETGVVQPVAEIAGLCAERGVPVHSDATQAVGKVSIDFATLGVAMLTFAAHKFHGPAGVGGLLVRHDVAPLRHLAGQADAERPGTPAVALAAGMRVALEAWRGEAAERQARMTNLRDRFEKQILTALPFALINGAGAERLPHTSNVSLVGIDRQALLIALDRAGVACSTGSACASGSAEPSPTLLAMGLPDAVVRGSLRFSLGAQTTAEEVDAAARHLIAITGRLQAVLDRKK